MLASKVTLTRDELYEKVWSTPMQKLAVEFGFSDRGFAKLCRRYKVPVPTRGYWARIQVGQRVQRIIAAKDGRCGVGFGQQGLHGGSGSNHSVVSLQDLALCDMVMVQYLRWERPHHACLKSEVAWPAGDRRPNLPRGSKTRCHLGGLSGT